MSAEDSGPPAQAPTPLADAAVETQEAQTTETTTEPETQSAATVAAASSSTAQAPTPTATTAATPSTTMTGTSTAATAAAQPQQQKPIHALVVDAGPLIKNDPPVSTLLAQSAELWTIPAVVEREIRDEAARARVSTQLLPFLRVRDPRPESVRFVQDFARRTGDLEVLSRPDVALLALAYELECERNGGDWRLRKTPGQKGVNGKPPGREEQGDAVAAAAEGESVEAAGGAGKGEGEVSAAQEEQVAEKLDSLTLEASTEAAVVPEGGAGDAAAVTTDEKPGEPATVEGITTADAANAASDDDDEDGWITPANLKKHQAKDQQAGGSGPQANQQGGQLKVLQAALLTSDFAMQNVALRCNLNLVGPQMSRITRVKTWAQRCHGCFAVTRQMERQFCPRCGQATLTRVACSTDSATGQFQVHLKKNFQWNNRGNVYSVPKPVHGSASGKKKGPDGGGGKGGWGTDLILAEDQKEFVQKTAEDRRQRQRDLMDDDYLPGILTGDRRGGGGPGGAGGRIRIGAGRNVNSRKR